MAKKKVKVHQQIRNMRASTAGMAKAVDGKMFDFYSRRIRRE